MTRNILLSTVLVSILFVGCSQGISSTRSPNFFPNDHFNKVGASQARQDTRVCMSLADEYVQDPSRFEEGAKNTAMAAVAGTAAGAVGGAIMGGSVGRYTAAGAATAAIIQVLRETRKAGQKSPNWEGFVQKCLENKGYQVYGWD